MSTPALPPGLNYIVVIEPGLVFSLLGSYFSGALVPLLIFLFMFSPKAARTHPVFLLNVFIIVLGLTLGAVNVGQEWITMTSPSTVIPDGLMHANITLSVLSPMIIDSVLIFRVLAFFPRITTKWTTYVLVLMFPVAVKIGRFIAVVNFLHRLGQAKGDGIAVLAAQIWFRNPFLVAEWCLQMCDNL